jgi:hypothetical protein
VTGHKSLTGCAHALLRETAQRLEQRTRICLLLPVIPVGVVVVALGAIDSLPLELLGAWTIATVVLALMAISVPDQKRGAAARLDAGTGGKAHFLTLATVSEADEPSPLLIHVSQQATHLSAGTAAKDFIPPLPRRPIIASAVVAIVIFLVAMHGPMPAPVPGPIERLESLAVTMEESGDQTGARALRNAIEALRDSERSMEEKRAAAEQAMRELEKENGGGNSSGADSKGTGSNANGEGNDAGNGSASLRDQARSELREITGQTSGGEKTNGEKTDGSGMGASGNSSKGSPETGHNDETGEGSGLDAPRSEGAGERQDHSPGNQPADDEGEADQGRSESENRQQGVSQKDQDGERAAGADSPGQQRPGHPTERPGRSGGERGFGDRAGNGEGEITDGRFVRVRIPDASMATANERVPGPGEIHLKTPTGNAPLPEAGDPDNVRARQPIPLEYRKALEGT